MNTGVPSEGVDPTSARSGHLEQSFYTEKQDYDMYNECGPSSAEMQPEFFALDGTSSDSAIKYEEIFLHCQLQVEPVPISFTGDSSPTLYENIPSDSDKISDDSLDDLLKATARTVESLSQQERAMATAATCNGEALKRIEEKLDGVIAQQAKLIKNVFAFKAVLTAGRDGKRVKRKSDVVHATCDDFGISYVREKQGICAMLLRNSGCNRRLIAGLKNSDDIMPLKINDAPFAVVEVESNAHGKGGLGRRVELWKKLSELETAVQNASAAYSNLDKLTSIIDAAEDEESSRSNDAFE